MNNFVLLNLLHWFNIYIYIYIWTLMQMENKCGGKKSLGVIWLPLLADFITSLV